MKISVSLPDDDVVFLDRYAQTVAAGSRSAVVQRAIRLLRATELGPAYAQAWEEWATGGDAKAWEAVAGDGIEPAP
jgi:Arc/MetJ-type ribon-helix-helix transcriptional regulator